MSDTSTQSQSTVVKSTSPLISVSRFEGPNFLNEQEWKGKIVIRGNSDNPDFLIAVKNATGTELPLTANTLSTKDDTTIYWLGPDEWMIHCDLTNTPQVIDQLRTELKDTHASVVEVTDYYVVLKLTGPDAAGLIARGSPLNVQSEAVIRPGSCAQTRFGHATILLHQLKEEEVAYLIQVRWTYAEYVWDYLLTASKAV